MHLLYPLVLGALLFSTGIYGVLARRNAVLILMSIELMLNSVTINLVAFDAWLEDTLHAGQVMGLFIITVAAAEVGLGLAIVLALFRARGDIALDSARDLREDASSYAQELAAAASEAPEGDQEQVQR